VATAKKDGRRKSSKSGECSASAKAHKISNIQYPMVINSHVNQKAMVHIAEEPAFKPSPSGHFFLS
jgi:hypothetical protein